MYIWIYTLALLFYIHSQANERLQTKHIKYTLSLEYMN